jgi:hypothetical protein
LRERDPCAYSTAGVRGVARAAVDERGGAEELAGDGGGDDDDDAVPPRDSADGVRVRVMRVA